MGYLIYGKRLVETKDKKGHIIPPDNRFAPLDWNGVRQIRKTEAFEYATKIDAQERLDSISFDPSKVVFEIRRS